MLHFNERDAIARDVDDDVAVLQVFIYHVITIDYFDPLPNSLPLSGQFTSGTR
jgi:hypothetical protein